MFNINDLVRIKKEFVNNENELKQVFKIVDINEVTNRCYIEIQNCNLPLVPQELVSFEMIEKI